jgi:hypothetical protein
VAKHKERWKEEPDPHDYVAAAAYLDLLLEEDEVTVIVDALKAASITRHLAKDLLRASRLPLLPKENFHVALDLTKVRSGDRLSPVLLVRGDLLADVALTVADGYHRICASYRLDENAPIPCRLAHLARRTPNKPND